MSAGPDDERPVAEDPRDRPAPRPTPRGRPHRMPPPPPPRRPRAAQPARRRVGAPAAALPRGAAAVGARSATRARSPPLPPVPPPPPRPLPPPPPPAARNRWVPAGRRHPGDDVAAAGPARAGRTSARRTIERARGRARRQPAASCARPGPWPSRRWSPGSPGCSARWCWPPRSASALVNDAYNTANTLPNIVYELLLGGVLDLGRRPAAGARPGARPRRRRRPTPSGWPPSPPPGWSWSPALAILAAPLLTSLYGITERPGPGASWPTGWPGILLIEIVFYGVGALAQAILNSRGVFGPPAWAPVLNNVVVIATGAAVHRRQRPGRPRPRRPSPPARSGCSASAPRSASPSRRSCCCPLLGRAGVPLRPRWGLREHRAARGRARSASG